MTRRSPLLAFVLPLVMTAACSDGSHPLSRTPPAAMEQGAERVEASATSTTLGIHVARFGDHAPRAEGTVDFGKGGEGRLTVQTLSSRVAGDGLVETRQLWTIHPPDPGKSFEVRLEGFIRGGDVSLQGVAEGYGAAAVEAVLVRGDLRGSIDIVGFNPQPEPPALPGTIAGS